MTERYGADTPVSDWRERLVCSRCGRPAGQWVARVKCARGPLLQPRPVHSSDVSGVGKVR
jgi:hypothetical protein